MDILSAQLSVLILVHLVVGSVLKDRNGTIKGGVTTSVSFCHKMTLSVCVFVYSDYENRNTHTYTHTHTHTVSFLSLEPIMSTPPVSR